MAPPPPPDPRSAAGPIVTQPDVGGAWPRPRPRWPRPGSPFWVRAAGEPRLLLLGRLVRRQLQAPGRLGGGGVGVGEEGQARLLGSLSSFPLASRLCSLHSCPGRRPSGSQPRCGGAPNNLAMAVGDGTPKIQLGYRSRGPWWLHSSDLGFVTLDPPAVPAGRPPESPGSGPSRIVSPQ